MKGWPGSSGADLRTAGPTRWPKRSPRRGGKGDEFEGLAVMGPTLSMHASSVAKEAPSNIRFEGAS
jgi:hypothetical protein